MTSTREDYGVRKPPSLKVASESYREEICEVARHHGTRSAKREGPPSTNVVHVAVTCKQSSSIGRLTRT